MEENINFIQLLLDSIEKHPRHGKLLNVADKSKFSAESFSLLYNFTDCSKF